MNLIDKLRERKRELGYNYRQISDLSGVPLGTVQKVLGGQIAHPRYDTLQALERVLLEQRKPADSLQEVCEEGRRGNLTGYSHREEEPLEVREEARLPFRNIPRTPTGVVGHYHQYTVEDREALPEERRTELIDGVIYDMASPATFHQHIAGQIYRQLCNYIFDRGGDCIPFIAPSDVQLDMDEWTMVQPDVFVICDRGRIRNKNVQGAPDLVVEVLSPSTRKKDMGLKLHKYANAGVREYWLVDPDKKTVIAYDLEHNMGISFYTFEGEVPVTIYGGKCRIDFAQIDRQLALFGEQADR